MVTEDEWDRVQRYRERRRLDPVPIDAAPYGATTTVTVLKEAITDQSGNHLESDSALVSHG